MAKDLTTSQIDRQNILNNELAIEEIQPRCGLEGVPWNNSIYVTREMTASFFQVDIRTISRYIEQNNEELTQNFVEVYKRLFYKFEEEKHLIPEGNLVELKFEDFEKDAYGMTEEIYRTLDLPNFAQSKTAIEAYLSKKKGYKKNRYKYEDATVRTVEENWGMALKEWGYHLNEE